MLGRWISPVAAPPGFAAERARATTIARAAEGAAPGVRFADLVEERSDRAREEILAALRGQRVALAPKYFYDRLGSTLFTAICELPEYYPTRTEASILSAHEAAVAAALPADCTLVDLGAGDCAKAERLFASLRPAQYVPVDISIDFLRATVGALAQRHPAIRMFGVAQDFSASLCLPDGIGDERRVFFYPGSSIGNFTPAEALRFLRRVRAQTDPDGALLIGVDFVKDADVLERAYDDSLGVTAAFNRNVLLHVNRLAGTDFDLGDWEHLARFDTAHGRIEMHLRARREVVVRWQGGSRMFTAGETIHTENSYKYTPRSFEALLAEAGYRVERSWTDARQWFGVFLARPR